MGPVGAERPPGAVSVSLGAIAISGSGGGRARVPQESRVAARKWDEIFAAMRPGRLPGSVSYVVRMDRTRVQPAGYAACVTAQGAAGPVPALAEVCKYRDPHSASTG